MAGGDIIISVSLFKHHYTEPRPHSLGNESLIKVSRQRLNSNTSCALIALIAPPFRTIFCTPFFPGTEIRRHNSPQPP